MTSKHTPGPWKRNIPPATKYPTVFAGRNAHICYLTPLAMTNEEAEANINLIAAAPAMYEALKEAKEVIANLHPGFEVYQKILDAIAKAEGVE